ncbi:MAG: hypothetical protein LBR10_02325 [Prevotellaceae bacterium]|jgi:hypothetical protein|nr:hypothetical protein [Prevotellaceae bacterium]
MINTVKIFVEGIADVKFLSDYIRHIIPDFKIIKGETIIHSGGWTSNREMIQQQMKQNTDNGGISLIIFDADIDFAARKKEIETWRTTSGLTFEIFLLPNNKDTGALEDLLENIILNSNQPIFDCWNGYERCLQSKIIEGRTEPLTIPAKKTKIYGYLEALSGKASSEKKKLKEADRDYSNIKHWNLDSDYLTPLKDFLQDSLLGKQTTT